RPADDIVLHAIWADAPRSRKRGTACRQADPGPIALTCCVAGSLLKQIQAIRRRAALWSSACRASQGGVGSTALKLWWSFCGPSCWARRGNLHRPAVSRRANDDTSMIDEALVFLKNQLNDYFRPGWGQDGARPDLVDFIDGEKTEPLTFKIGAVSVLLIN